MESNAVKTLKVTYNNETRRFAADQALLANVETLKSHIKLLFQVPPTTAISLFWRDEDGEHIHVVRDDELSEAVRSAPRNVLHLFANASPSQSQAQAEPQPQQQPRAERSNTNTTTNTNTNTNTTHPAAAAAAAAAQAAAAAAQDAGAAAAHAADNIIRQLPDLLAQAFQAVTTTVSPLLQEISKQQQEHRERRERGEHGRHHGGAHHGPRFPFPFAHHVDRHCHRRGGEAAATSSSSATTASEATATAAAATAAPPNTPASASSAQSQGQEAAPVHLHVICDGCRATPIVGSRFKCAECPDFDLCSACETKGLHAEHVMVRLRVPAPHLVVDIDDQRERVRVAGARRGGRGGRCPFRQAAEQQQQQQQEQSQSSSEQSQGEQADGEASAQTAFPFPFPFAGHPCRGPRWAKCDLASGKCEVSSKCDASTASSACSETQTAPAPAPATATISTETATTTASSEAQTAPAPATASAATETATSAAAEAQTAPIATQTTATSTSTTTTTAAAAAAPAVQTPVPAAAPAAPVAAAAPAAAASVVPGLVVPPELADSFRFVHEALGDTLPPQQILLVLSRHRGNAERAIAELLQ